MKLFSKLFLVMLSVLLFVSCPTSPSSGGNNNIAPSWARGTYQDGDPESTTRNVLEVSESKVTYSIGAASPGSEPSIFEYGKEIVEEHEGEGAGAVTQERVVIKTTIVTSSDDLFEFHVIGEQEYTDGIVSVQTMVYKITPDGRCVGEAYTDGELDEEGHIELTKSDV